MKELKEYIIPLLGLKPGSHLFEYQVESSFFQYFKHGAIREGSIAVTIELEKKIDLFILKIGLNGTINCECDRCLDSFDMAFKGNHQILFKYNSTEDGFKENEHDVIYIAPTDSHYNLSQLIYEYINLSLPMQKVHPLDDQGNYTCTGDAAKLLKDRSAEDSAGETDIDPRWEKLKQFKQ